MTIIEDGLEANVARLKEEYPDETWEIESSAYERGLEDGRKVAAMQEDAQPTRLTHRVKLERDTRQELEALWAEMRANPTEITKEQIRYLISTDGKGRDASPIKPLEEASEAYFADVNTRADAAGKDRDSVPGDPELYENVLEMLDSAQIISGVHEDYKNRLRRALADWYNQIDELSRYADVLEPYDYHNAKVYKDVVEHYNKTSE